MVYSDLVLDKVTCMWSGLNEPQLDRRNNLKITTAVRSTFPPVVNIQKVVCGRTLVASGKSSLCLYLVLGCRRDGMMKLRLAWAVPAVNGNDNGITS